MQRITIRLPDHLLTAIEERAAEEGRKVSCMIRRILSLDLRVPDTEELDTDENPKLPGLP